MTVYRLSRPGIHAPEPVRPRTENFFEKSDRTAPGPKKPQKFRTNSHRAVRGPGDAWILDHDLKWLVFYHFDAQETKTKMAGPKKVLLKTQVPILLRTNKFTGLSI